MEAEAQGFENIDFGPRVVVVVPAYNEERFIGSTVIQAKKYAYRVIVVDDGSKDATVEIAKMAGATVVEHEVNQGKGVALMTGFKAASKYNPDVVVTIDGDGQHLPSEIPNVARPVLEDKADIVVGSRYVEQKSDVPVHRILGHQVFNVLTNGASGVPVTDSQSGFRAFSAKVLDAFSFQSASFSVECEMQFIAHEQGMRVAEVPITILYNDKPKRPVVQHGFIVLDGLMRLIGQYRPLFFFGAPGLAVVSMGLLMSLWVSYLYSVTNQLAIGYALVVVMLVLIGSLLSFTGVILHSIRGLLLERKEESAEVKTQVNPEPTRQAEPAPNPADLVGVGDARLAYTLVARSDDTASAYTLHSESQYNGDDQQEVHFHTMSQSTAAKNAVNDEIGNSSAILEDLEKRWRIPEKLYAQATNKTVAQSATNEA